MKKLEYKSFEIKAAEINSTTNEMFIEGYAATFGNEDAKQLTWYPEINDFVLASDTIDIGSFKKTISERKNRIAFCKNHNFDDAKGKIIELKEDEIGLFIRVRISDAEQELKTKLKEEIYNEFSIGFTVINSNWEKKEDGLYIRHLTEIKLYEISVVTVARDENAKITDRKSYQIAINTIDSLIKTEKNEEKKYKLLQLKSLFDFEPEQPLEQKKPNEIKRSLNLSKYKFINTQK
jgi:uncharacterized protein